MTPSLFKIYLNQSRLFSAEMISKTSGVQGTFSQKTSGGERVNPNLTLIKVRSSDLSTDIV